MPKDNGPAERHESESAACSALQKDRAQANNALRETSESKDPLKHIAAIDDAERATFTSCHKTKSGGAWGLGLQNLRAEHNGTSAELYAVHADPKGTVTKLKLEGKSARVKERGYVVDENDHVSLETPRLFDYDGDGEEELVLVGRDQLHEGPKEPAGYIVTEKAGVVSLYAPLRGENFFRVEDTDRDGRLDVVTYGPYHAHIGARCNGSDVVATGPALLLHSLADGTFSADDAVAVAFAKPSCDRGPLFAIARDEAGGVDDEQTFVNLVCSRLFGSPEPQATAVIGKSCAPLPSSATCTDASLKQCVYPQILRQWAKITPPLTLR